MSNGRCQAAAPPTFGLPKRAATRPALNGGWPKSLVLLLALGGLSGCHAGTSPWTVWRTASGGDGLVAPVEAREFDEAKMRARESGRVEQPQSLLARWLDGSRSTVNTIARPFTIKGTTQTWVPPVKEQPDPEADAALAQADQLAAQGDDAAAEEAFAKLARRYENTSWGEAAQFKLGLVQFRRGRFTAARDSFEKAIKTYPGTRHLDVILAHQYALGEYWLKMASPELAQGRIVDPETSPLRQFDDKLTTAALTSASTTADGRVVKLARANDPASYQIPLDKPSWIDRLKGRLPLVDSGGHGVQLLERIRHHDPQGPLAPRAALLIADYYASIGSYDEAARYYTQVVTEYPKSPEALRARLDAIDAKLKAYVGPNYDGQHLEECKTLIRQFQTLAPDQPEINAALYRALDQIKDQEAQRAFLRGEYYMSIGKVTSAEYMFGSIPRKWPQSRYVEPARERLEILARMPRRESIPSRTMVAPGAEDPFAGAQNGIGNTMAPF